MNFQQIPIQKYNSNKVSNNQRMYQSKEEFDNGYKKEKKF